MVATIERAEVVVVGGGIAGLGAAALLSRSSVTVTLLEKARAAGGRAATTERDGFLLNLGPHALYAAGEARSLLRELGIEVPGKRPPARGGLALARGQATMLPATPWSLLATRLVPLAGKLPLARALARILGLDPRRLSGTPVAAWLRDTATVPEVRDVLAALLRVATYASDPGRQDAGAALAQLQRAVRTGVLYLHGGWQEIADGLVRTCVDAGAAIRTGAAVTAVRPDAGAYVVETLAGDAIRAPHVLLALPPADASGLLRAGGLTPPPSWALSIPVRAACLDLGLGALPRPRTRFALGIDRPLYYSVHSATADLAPEGAALVHVAAYIGSDPPPDPRAVERELEGVLDLLQPGWRDLVQVRRFLPSMVVSHGLHAAGVERPGVGAGPDLWVAGDWVGAEGMLADAAAASARRAAEGILASLRARAAATPARALAAAG